MDEARIKRVRLRAWRRGFREADLILGPFADSHAGGMSEPELDRLEELLELPDTDLYDWIAGTRPTPPRFDHDVMARLRAFRPR